MSILALTSTYHLGNNNKKIRVKIQLELIEHLSKSLIANSRFAGAKALIVLKNDSNPFPELDFIYDGKIVHKLQLPRDDFRVASFKTGSIFEERIEIRPDGFVSPASLTIETSTNRKCSWFFSRLGNVRKTCKS